MKITLDKNTAVNGPNPYTSRETRKTMFRYIISGTPQELEAFKKTKGVHYRENAAKEPLLFSQTLYSNDTELRANKEATNYYVDDTEQRIYAQACKEGGAEFAAQKVAEYKAQIA